MKQASLHPNASILEAAQLMESSGLRELRVTGADGAAMGFLTDRDIVLRVIAKGLDPMQVRVADVMTGADAIKDWEASEPLEHQDYS